MKKNTFVTAILLAATITACGPSSKSSAGTNQQAASVLVTFQCLGTGAWAFPVKSITFDVNKSETKPLATVGGLNIQAALDAANSDGTRYLSLEVIATGGMPALTGKGSIKDLVLLLSMDSSGTNVVDCVPVNN